jgi:hypothetical protein
METTIDLYKNKYDRETLKLHIYAVKMLDVLKTQTIDVTFAVRYILNSKYHFFEEDSMITPKTVLFYQPHITREELQKGLIFYDSDDDSVDDFETYANKHPN